MSAKEPECAEDEATGEVLRVQAMYDFDSTCDVELGLKHGDVVTVLRQDVGDGWWEGRNETTGKEGLFPATYVEVILPDSDDDWPAAPPDMRSAPMREDGSSSPSGDRKSVLDMATARKLLITGKAPCIVAGPAWYAEPPSYVVRVTNPRKDSKLNGMKQFIVYDIESFESDQATSTLTVVSRRYKHFLWLHSSLLDLFPGVLVPILPVKQFSGRFEDEFIRVRQQALERFLKRIARHPLLRASHAFNHFLTATSFQDWKFGKHNVRRSVVYSKPTKKLESPTYFFSLNLPPNNVPYDRVLVVESFSKFTSVLRRGTVLLRSASDAVSTTQSDMGSSCEKLGRALTSFASGRPFADRRSSAIQPSSGGSMSPQLRAKDDLHNGASQTSPASARTAGSTVFVPSQEVSNWCWRKDCAEFAQLMGRMHGVGSALCLMSKFVEEHKQESDTVANTAKEYIGLLQAMPSVTHAHEEAIDQLNVAKAGNSRETLSTAQRHCEITSNITLSEINHFHESFLTDFDSMMASFLQQQIDFHSKVAHEYQVMLDYYQRHTVSNN